MAMYVQCSIHYYEDDLLNVFEWWRKFLEYMYVHVEFWWIESLVLV